MPLMHKACKRLLDETSVCEGRSAGSPQTFFVVEMLARTYSININLEILGLLCNGKVR